MVLTTSASVGALAVEQRLQVVDGLRDLVLEAAARRVPSFMPIWPDTTSQSPARTIGRVGTHGLGHGAVPQR